MSDDLLGNFRSGTPTTRSSPFGYTGDDPSQLFEDLGRGINPSGFVSNVDNAPANVIIDETGITVIDGAITVRNPGATVIIDGTSDMFRIAATGTLSTSSFTNPANPGASAQVDIATGFTYQPAALIYQQAVESYLVPTLVIDNAGTVLDWYTGKTSVVNTNQTRVKVEVASSRGTGTTNATNWRYYVIEQIAF